MFIDAGDEFISKEVQEEIAQTVESDKDTDVFFWLYYYKDQLVNHGDNRLHGKVYKRSFLKKYDIAFSRAGSYMNEDIGFNRTCRIILKDRYKEIRFIDIPVIKWIANDDSLTQKDNNRSLYESQNRALAINSTHCISCCRKNKVKESLITEEINEIAMALYYWFIRAAAERPEFIRNAWDGARIFYSKFSKEINPRDLIIGSTRMKQCLYYRDKINFPINILRFTRDILFFKEIPSYYLTKM